MATQSDSGASRASSPLSSPPESTASDPELKKAIEASQSDWITYTKDQVQDTAVASGEAIEDHLQNLDTTIEVDTAEANMAPKRTFQTAFNKKLNDGTKKVRVKSKKWDPDFLLEDPNSALTKVDLRALLSLPQAWTVLTAEEKKDILAKFPNEQHIISPGTEDACPNIKSLRNDDNFRHDVARFGDAIANGQLDPQWLQEAWVAHERRRAGEFDDFKMKKFESDWGVELPEEFKKANTPPQQETEASGQMDEAPDELSGPANDLKTEAPVEATNGNVAEPEKRPVEKMEVDLADTT